MALTSSRTDENEGDSESPFPKLMISNEGRIVLFESSFTGTLVYTPYHNEKPSNKSKNWAAQCFKDYYGEVTLKQTRG